MTKNGMWHKVSRAWLCMTLSLGMLTITASTGQAGFFVIPVVRDSAVEPSTPCANDGYEVLSATGRCWMAFNLGATQVATSIDDEAAYGDLYQWGRRVDGHERRNLDPATETTTVLSARDNPGHGDFIIGMPDPYDWRLTKNDFLWQGLGGVNNPCPQGFRLPSAAEWQDEVDKYGDTVVDLFNSPLKLVVAGWRGGYDGLIYNEGERAHYWSSTVRMNSDDAQSLYMFPNGHAAIPCLKSMHRYNGLSVRCIKD